MSTFDPKSSGAMPTWVVGPAIPPESRIGATIEGEYRVDRILSQGELGPTYQAWNARLKRNFAVLMLSREVLPTHEMMLAVRADLRRAQALSTLGMMPVKQVTDQQGIPGFATELLDGETLRQRLSRGPLSVERALSLGVVLGRALEAAHKDGLIHGDLRPESIFLVKVAAKHVYAGRAVLLKHSLRHLRRRPVGFDDSLPIGKLMYRPPEQVAGQVTSADVSGDMFTLGAILHECLTGVPAFAGSDVEGVLDRLATPPSLLRPNPGIGLIPSLTEALNVVVSGACAREPEGRIQSMGDFVKVLVQVAQGAHIQLFEQISEAPSSQQGRFSRIIQRLSGAFPTVAQKPQTPDQKPLEVRVTPPSRPPLSAQKPTPPSKPALDQKVEPAVALAPTSPPQEDPSAANPSPVAAEPVAPAAVPVVEDVAALAGPVSAVPETTAPVSTAPETAGPVSAALETAAAPAVAEIAVPAVPPVAPEIALAPVEAAPEIAKPAPPKVPLASPPAQPEPQKDPEAATLAAIQASLAALAGEDDKPKASPQRAKTPESVPQAEIRKPLSGRIPPPPPKPTPGPIKLPTPPAVPLEEAVKAQSERIRVRRSSALLLPVIPLPEGKPADPAKPVQDASQVQDPPAAKEPSRPPPLVPTVELAALPEGPPPPTLPKSPPQKAKTPPSVLPLASATPPAIRPVAPPPTLPLDPLPAQQAAAEIFSQRPTVVLPSVRPVDTGATTEPPRAPRYSLLNPVVSSRTTKQMRAPDISMLVAAVQQGRLDPSLAIEEARKPVEIEGDTPHRPEVSLSPMGNPAPNPLPYVLTYEPPPSKPPALRRFLLDHQELVAAALGALTILLCGLILMWCRR